MVSISTLEISDKEGRELPGLETLVRIQVEVLLFVLFFFR